MKLLKRKLLLLSICIIFSSCFFVLDGGSGWNERTRDNLVKGYDTKNMFLHEIQLEINKVRSNPSLYATEVLEPRLRRYNGYLYRNDEGELLITKEGVNAMRECIRALEKAEDLDVLEMEKGLYLAAQSLANDQAISGKKGHIASDGSNIEERMNRYGTHIGLVDEICIYGYKNPRDIVISLLVDDGTKSRKHRKSILNDNFRKIGIGFSSEYRAPEGAVTVINLTENYFSY